MRKVIASILLLTGACYALVEFSKSALYDVYDFEGEISIPKCNVGCRIYASTGGYFQTSNDGLDPYAKNLIIVDNDNNKRYSIASIASGKDAQKRKIPLDFKSLSRITVVNENDKDDKKYNMVLYVVDLATASDNHDYEMYDIYDVMYRAGTVLTTNTDIVTFMGVHPFFVSAQPSNQPNSASGRLTGFDNALNANPDGCPYSFQTAPDSPTFPGFNMFFPGPIGSIVYGKQGPMKVTVNDGNSGVFDLSMDGCIVSNGFSGCSRPGVGPLPTFKFPQREVQDSVVLSSNTDDYAVTMTILPQLKDGSKIKIDDNTGFGSKTITGSTATNVHFDKTENVFIGVTKLSNPEGYIIRYNTTLVPKPSTATGTTTVSSSTTVEMTSPTTSGVEKRTSLSVLALLVGSLLMRFE
ncbi:hypothetical protein PFISCL1PPCAC_11514 [Pristionchus fissidentatus]|uniref:Uncharacterized protein n=1 Tax=Pristionchus fissidentatus TaxID=1538716 RepID=A0AAV5VQ97_9BILA|nr:hypothetical protein PFISCL1PPCAC_11514 [Pristionchus fissidentatus]